MKPSDFYQAVFLFHLVNKWWWNVNNYKLKIETKTIRLGNIERV